MRCLKKTKKLSEKTERTERKEAGLGDILWLKWVLSYCLRLSSNSGIKSEGTNLPVLCKVSAVRKTYPLHGCLRPAAPGPEKTRATKNIYRIYKKSFLPFGLWISHIWLETSSRYSVLLFVLIVSTLYFSPLIHVLPPVMHNISFFFIVKDTFEAKTRAFFTKPNSTTPQFHKLTFVKK